MNSQASRPSVKRIADSTVRRLSAYLRFLEDFEGSGLTTISSDELARRGGTTSAQVRKDLSFFGSFGKRGLGYSVPELKGRLREILGLGREWRVVIVGAGKIGAALAQYRDQFDWRYRYLCCAGSGGLYQILGRPAALWSFVAA